MNKISCLLFDDDANDAKSVERLLKIHWSSIQQEYKSLPDIEVKTTLDYAEAIDLANTGNYELLICDVVVTRKGEKNPSGLEVIEFVRRYGRIPVVVSISRNESANLHKYFKRADMLSDRYVRKLAFDQDDVSEIIAILGEKGILQYRGEVLRERADDPMTESIVEQIGIPALSAFANHFDANESSSKVFISAIRPGLSGAHIVRLRYQRRDIDISKQCILLKISTDQEALKREHDRFQEIVRRNWLIGGRLRVLFFPKQPFYSTRGWHALGADFEDGATTLIDWLLRRGVEGDEVRKFLEQLFHYDDGLADASIASKDDELVDCVSLLKKSMFTNRRVALIVSARDELEALIRRHTSDSEANATLVALGRLLQKNAVDVFPALRIDQRMMYCYQHGDLHGRNVLHTRPGPKIIDYASIGRYPWPTDLVRLLVDIGLSCFDSDSIGYEWLRLTPWMTLVEAMLSGKTESIDESLASQAAPCAALDWLCSHRFSMFQLEDSPVHRGEFALALSMELARASYRKADLPAPKRAFALIAAAAAFRTAEREFASERRYGAL